LRCLAGLPPSTSGPVVLDGVTVTRVPDRLAVFARLRAEVSCLVRATKPCDQAAEPY